MGTRHTLSLVFGLATWAMAPGCSGDLEFHSNRGFDDMTCDDSGCWMCSHGDCEEYRCDATHQCPMQRSCSADNRCVVGDGSSAQCDSNDDCALGQICTLEGVCVKSPGGGPDASGDTTDTSTTDTSSDIGLPDHPDNTCLTAFDCGLDGTCVNGGCFFPCEADGSCPPGQVCNGGQCEEHPENECTFNGECGTSHVCVEGTCYVQCEETLDCPSHTRCSGGLCIADTTPVIQCSGPGSCAEGRSCVDGKCLQACDGVCGQGFSCVFDFCTPTASCFDQNDCGGAACVNGQCAAQ